MRRLIGYLVIIVCLLIYTVSSSDKLTGKISRYKYYSNSPIVRSEKYRYGDLYGLAWLPHFKQGTIFKDPIKPTPCAYPRKIDLYEVCDSYLWEFFKTPGDYCGVSQFKSAKTNNKSKLNITLDTTKINVLLLEMSERNLSKLLNDTSYVNHVINIQKHGFKQAIATNTIEADITSQSLNVNKKATIQSTNKGRLGVVEDFVFNKKINSNIESNIWETAIFTPVKEAKAYINFMLFHTLDNNVDIDKNNKQLFLNVTTDISAGESAFRKISDKEVDTLVSRINKVSNYSKKLGFKKVYLSIIPNPVSIIEPDHKGQTYNHLLERVQYSNKLQVPVIDVLNDFKSLKNKAYFTSDTHWSWFGAHLWLNKFNAELGNIIEEQK